MRSKTIFVALLALAACVVAILVGHQPFPRAVSKTRQPRIHVTAQPAASGITQMAQPSLREPQPKLEMYATTLASSKASPRNVRTNRSLAGARSQSLPTAGPKRQLEDPIARVALAFVGEDAQAEAYWACAIFDTNLSDGERDDLMEDLNEVGFEDPDHPGPEDLPLIENRLAIIQGVAPYASSFMLRHLGEAWKDLNNMESLALAAR